MPNAQEVLEWMAWDKERKANMTNEEWFCQLSTEEKQNLDYRKLICLCRRMGKKRR